jgi:DNA-binding MarR family transcriptional regulator
VPRVADESPAESPVEVVDALLRASRALVAVAARSLAAVDHDVTLAQYRTLVVLASRGPQTPGALAAALGVHASTVTRMCDRLVAKRLIRRGGSPTNRREVDLRLTAKGRRLVDSVTRRRREEIAEIVARVPGTQRRAMVRALNRFGEAATEPGDSGWFLDWTGE